MKFCFIFFRGELEERERVAIRERQKERARKEGKALDSPPQVKKSRAEPVTYANLDADDPVDSSGDSDSDSDDDTAILMAELNKIKVSSEKEVETITILGTLVSKLFDIVIK